jgi:heparan-alpha-glucosaminide N-acetyltransferase
MAVDVEPLPQTRTKPQVRPATGTARLGSLDAYRGFVMLAMASGGLGTAHLLKDPTWGPLADQLEHRQWVGCTFWDLIQPSFMFIVGVAMPFSFARRQEQGDSWGRQFRHALWRALLLVLIGVALDSWGKSAPVVQMIRVLQQIAIGYVIAFLVLHRGPLVQATAAVGLLGLHTCAFLWYGWAHGTDPWLRDQNVGTWLDQFMHQHLSAFAEQVTQALFGCHNTVSLMPLSTGGYVTFNAISSAGTILFGVLCGELFRGDWPTSRKLRVLGMAGVGGLLVGGLLGGGEYAVGDGYVILPTWVPLVKRIWTSSFAVFAAGWTCLMMLAFFLIIDVWKLRAWSLLLVMVGMNSILMYVLAQVLKGTVREGLKPFVQGPLSYWPKAGPVVLAALVVAVLWLICYGLYRRRIFLRL